MMDEPTQGGDNTELEALGKLMTEHKVAEAAGLVLAAWRLYWLARTNMIAVSEGRITEQNFAVISEALAKSACSGFKIGRFKTQMKRSVMPFLRMLSMREVQPIAGEKNVQQPDADSE